MSAQRPKYNNGREGEKAAPEPGIGLLPRANVNVVLFTKIPRDALIDATGEL